MTAWYLVMAACIQKRNIRRRRVWVIQEGVTWNWGKDNVVAVVQVCFLTCGKCEKSGSLGEGCFISFLLDT